MIYLSVDVFVYIHPSAFVYITVCWQSCAGTYACMCTVQTAAHTRLSRLQVCAASLCAPLIEISIAKGPLMACTCVSHYSKLQILQSKGKMFHSHFVISSMRKKLSVICDSRKIPVRILKAIMTDLWNHSPGDTRRRGMVVVSHKWNLVPFVPGMNINEIFTDNELQTEDVLYEDSFPTALH